MRCDSHKLIGKKKEEEKSLLSLESPQLSLFLVLYLRTPEQAPIGPSLHYAMQGKGRAPSWSRSSHIPKAASNLKLQSS